MLQREWVWVVKTLMGLGQASIESTKSSIPMAFSLAMTPAPIADAPAVRDAAEDDAAAAVAPMKAVAASCPIPSKIRAAGSDALLACLGKMDCSSSSILSSSGNLFSQPVNTHTILTHSIIAMIDTITKAAIPPAGKAISSEKRKSTPYQQTHQPIAPV